MMRVPRASLVIVADGGKMLCFRNEGRADQPRLIILESAINDNPADRDQKSDAPGRSFSSVGNSRSSMQEVDFHALEEERFAAQTADMLKRRALRRDFEALVVVAPPRILGALRKRYHKEVSDRIAAEIPKDLVSHPVAAIEQALIAA